MSDNARGALYMAVSMAAFTLNDTAMKAATQTLPLFQTIALRGIIAVVGLLLLGWAMRNLRFGLDPADRLVVAIRCLAELGATGFFLAALVQMPLANLSAILQALPLAVTLAAAVVFRERIGWRRMTAILIGFLGVLMIIRPGTSGFDHWSLVALASVACVVVRDLAARRLSRDVPSVTVAIWAAISVTLMGAIVASVEGWVPVTPQEGGLIAIAAVLLIAGYMMSVMVMRVGDIGAVAPFRYTSLLWAILLGWLVFGQFPDGWTLAGSALVVATGLFTVWRESRLRRVSRN